MNRTEHKRKLLYSIFVAFVTVGIGISATASEARRFSLAQNPMVLDDTDVVYYPGALSAYSNQVFLNLYPAGPTGNGGVFVDFNNVVLGLWVHRTSLYDDMLETNRVFSLDLPETYDIADLYMGFRNGFGIRLSLAAGLDSFDSQTDPDSDQLYGDGASTFVTTLMPGYSFDTTSYHGDFGIGVTLPYYKQAVSGESAYKTGGIPSLMIRHRSIFGARTAPSAMVLDVNLTQRSYTVTSEEADGFVGHWLASMVLGPRFKFPRDFTVWAGLKGTFEREAGIFDGDPTNTITGIGAPGVILSAELMLWQFMAIRVGADYDVYWTIANVLDEDGETTEKQRLMGQQFNWTTGVGFALAGFQLDATISHQLYFDGPDFIGGQAPGLLGMISATYMW